MTDGGWFIAWAVVGCGLALGVISFAIGPFALVAAGLLAALLLSRPAARGSAYGLLIGIGALLLYVAYLNRAGPGTTCWQHGSTTGCDEHLNPLPWLVLGVAFVAGGFIAHRMRH